MPRFTGGCLCGDIRYAAEGEPYHENICHCVQCRLATGAPFAAFFSLPRAAVRWLGVEPRRFRSSDIAERGFCPRCGTSLTYESLTKPAEIDLAIATLDAPEAVVPKDELFTARRIPWARLATRLPEHEGQRGG